MERRHLGRTAVREREAPQAGTLARTQPGGIMRPAKSAWLCVSCQRTMIGEYAWRQGHRNAETYHGAFGKCRACYVRAARAARRTPRQIRPRPVGYAVIPLDDLL